ncbi:MAG: glycosyltransferase [Acetobacteraceae bacterium]|nr:glycosyltransferase [Acetobacteraceae bacterium]
MRVVIFGLTVSSTWGNGHAALWRGLIGALQAQGHSVVFFERDVPYYAAHRDTTEAPGGARLVLYGDWHDILPSARGAVNEADAAIVTSYCPDALAATALVLDSRVAARCFYDLDTPVTIARLAQGRSVDYVPLQGLSGFDIVLSYTGGAAIAALREKLGARRVVPIYGSVDPDVHRPTEPQPRYAGLLSYIGTYAEDRQAALERLFIEPARRLPARRFMLAGALYPPDFPWTENIFFVRHLPPGEHPSFYCSSRLTLNVTRGAMARMGWCPSGRLFEAAACGAPILSDSWDGLDAFLEPGKEIFTANDTSQAMTILALPLHDLLAVARRARERTLDEHTASVRARELVAALEPITQQA